VNLALSMAQKWGRVLLIDCDLRKPACHTIMETAQPKYCVNDCLAGKAELKGAVVTDRLSGLRVLYARKAPGTSAGDLLNAGRLQELIRQAREMYSFVVIDLPPMSAATDAEYIADYADASLLVVRQNGVGSREINHAISVLENVRAHLLGCVLNNVYSSFLTSGDGYGGGYGSRGYGKYGKYGKYGHYGAYASSKKGR